MHEEIRFGHDVGGAARAMMRKAKDIALAGRRDDQISVVEAAIEHSAFKRKRECVMLGYELRHGFRPGSRIQRLKIDQSQCPKRANTKIIILAGRHAWKMPVTSWRASA